VCIVVFWGLNVRWKISRICQITDPEKLEKENDSMYKIIGIIDGHYIVQTPKGLKKVKVFNSNKKNIRDEIKIEKL
jgi:hypothetical protein